MGKASKVIRDEKKIKKKKINRQKSCFPIFFSTYLQIAKPYFASRADKGEGSVFVVEDG